MIKPKGRGVAEIEERVEQASRQLATSRMLAKEVLDRDAAGDVEAAAAIQAHR